jgi:PDZ domain-containing secreted protein
MKKLLLSIIALVMISMTIVSCGSKNDPKAVALNYLNALKSLDYEGAKKFSTPETGKMLDMLSSFSSMMPDSMKEQTKKIKIEIKEAKEEGDKCTVKFVSSDKPESEEVLNMVKKDGKWLVNMGKDDMNGGGAPMEETAPTNDSLSVDAAPTDAPATDAAPATEAPAPATEEKK